MKTGFMCNLLVWIVEVSFKGKKKKGHFPLEIRTSSLTQTVS